MDLCLTARNPGARASDAPVELWEDERLLVSWTGAELIAPKNTVVRDWQGVSYRVGGRASVRAGTSTTYATVDRPTPIDRGTLVVTDRRVLFLGRTRSIDWQFRRLLGVTHDDSGTWTALHVSNRQRVNGVGYPRSHGDDVRFYVALATALYRGDEAEFSATLEADTIELLGSPPSVPAGVPSDERLARIAAPRRVDEAVSAVKEIAASAPRSLAIGFSTAPLPIVATAAELIGFIVGAVQPGPSVMTPSDLDSAMRGRAGVESKGWVAVLAGDPGFMASYLDGCPSATVMFVCADAEKLDALGIAAVDSDLLTASEVGYARTSPEHVVADLQGDGYRASAISLGDQPGPNDVAVLDAVARLAHWTKDRPQALVLSGSEAALGRLRTQTRAYDLVAYCAPADVLQRIGLEVLDGEVDAVDDDDRVVTGHTPPITVAGRTIDNPLVAVARYLVEHPGTVVHYDFAAGTSEEVTSQLVRATRRPWMNSRISAAEETWFIERARSAPWGLVAPDAQLRDADPTRPGKLYDAASTLWDHFWSDAPKGVGVAKISKVLYLMRPALFPILDSRLTSLYDATARAAAREVATHRPEFKSYKRLDWEAVRRDLLSNDRPLGELRTALKNVEVALAPEASAKLSDLRLLDMLAWAAAGEPSADDEREN